MTPTQKVKIKRAEWSAQVLAAQNRAKWFADEDIKLYGADKASWVLVYQIERRRLCRRIKL